VEMERKAKSSWRIRYVIFYYSRGTGTDLKAGLLSLMSSITGGKDTVVKSKLDNQRRRNNPADEPKEETAAGPNKDKKKERHEKKKLDNRALVSYI
jgi:prophage tail gpP-like protein